MSKLRASSPKKLSQDRSQSVDIKKKLLKKEEVTERERSRSKSRDDKSRRKSSHNIQNKQNTTFNVSQRISGVL